MKLALDELGSFNRPFHSATISLRPRTVNCVYADGNGVIRVVGRSENGGILNVTSTYKIIGMPEAAPSLVRGALWSTPQQGTRDQNSPHCHLIATFKVVTVVTVSICPERRFLTCPLLWDWVVALSIVSLFTGATYQSLRLT